MPDSAEQLIINRLAAAPSIHPSGANLFVQDWALEPGDIVTVQSGEESYQVPIYSMNLKWNGTSMLDIQSTGNQKRNPLSALNEKKTNEFRSGRRGLAVQQEAEEAGRQQYEHYVEQTDAYRTEIYRVNGVRYDGDGNIIYQTDPETGEYILDGAGNKIPVYDENSDGSISGQVIQSAQRMATIIKQTGTVLEVFDKRHQYYEGDRVLYPDSNGNVYRFITDHNPGDWKGTGEHGDVEAVGTLQSQIDQNVDYTASIYGTVETLDGDVTRIKGTTAYQNDDAIANILGTVEIDQETGNLVVKDGKGLYVTGDSVINGFIKDNELDSGFLIQRINGNTEATIKADKINTEGIVTAMWLDARLINVDNLFSDTGFFGGINVHSITTNGGGQTGDGVGTITGDILYATSQLSIGHGAGSGGAAAGSFYYQGAEYTPKTVKKAGTVQDNIKLFGTGTDTEIDIGGSGILDASVANNVLTLTKSDGTTTVNFSKATTLHTSGSYTVENRQTSAGWSSGTFTVIGTQTNKNTTTGQNETTVVGDASTTLYGILPNGDPTPSSVLPKHLSVPLKVTYDDGDEQTESEDKPLTGFTDTISVDASDIWQDGYEKGVEETASGYDIGYAAGQDNADAAIHSISIENGTADYSSNQLWFDIFANPDLVLTDKDGVQQTPITKTGMTDTLGLPVAVTNVSITDSSIVYNNNGTYTIGGSGGNVNIGAVNGVGGANIPVDTNAHPFTPTEALNDVNVVKGSWTGTAEKSITFTTDAPSPNANAPKTLTIATSQGNWTWTTVNDASFYQKEVQVKDKAITTAIMTEPVDLPDISVYVEGPGQQQDSWWQTEGTNANKYVVPASTANAYLTSDSSKQHSIVSDTGDESIVINPSQAIEHGKSLVSVTRTWTEYDGTPSGDTTLDPGKTYHLEVKKDSTTVYDELYTVPEQTAPTVNTWGLAHQTGTDYTYKASVNVNGTTYESGNLNATEAYNNGWTGAYQSVGIFPTAVADLVPGGSPITIYAQAKATSNSAKTNVASVQVKARALNLKDETFTANDTYAVPEGYDGYGAITVNVQGGGGSSDRRAVFLDNITLAAPTNPEPGFNWQFTESSFAHYTDPVSVETDADKKTQVTIDASAIYQAGFDAGGGGGVVDVIKGDWVKTSSTQAATCEFSTNTGGATQSVSLSQSADSPQTDLGRLSFLDGSSHISTAYFLLQRENDKVVMKYAPFSYTNDIIRMAAIKLSLGRSGQTIASYTVGSSEAPIIESDVDDVVKNPTQNVTYSEDYKTAYIPVQALDENDNELLSKIIFVGVEGAWNDGHTKGVEEGSGIKIEQEKEVTASQNNTTITVLPTYTASEQYDVMGSVKVKVQVPTYEGISSARISNENDTEGASWHKELGKGTLSSKFGQIEITGVDGSKKHYIVDASNVFQNGFNDGAGAEFQLVHELTLQGPGPRTVTPVDNNTAIEMNNYGLFEMFFKDRWGNYTSAGYHQWYYSTGDVLRSGKRVFYEAGTDIKSYSKGQTYTDTYYLRRS